MTYIPAVGDHTLWPTGLSNGVDTAQNTRLAHLIPLAVSALRLSYVNATTTSSAEADGPNSITLRAAIEYPLGVYTPVLFGGARDAVVVPGATVTSDPVALSVPAGSTIFSRQYVSVASAGLRWPVGPHTNRVGDGYESGTTITDKTTSGVLPTVNDTAGFGPVAIQGTTAVPSVLVVATGASQIVGLGDTGYEGYVDRSLRTAMGFVNLAITAERAQSFAAAHSRRAAFLSSATHILSDYGGYDIAAGRSLAQIKTDLLAVWSALASTGARVYQMTLTPRTTSTDAWATTGNQTVVANFGVGSTRTQINAWIRTLPSRDLAGYIETADAVETARDSGIWKAGYTADGILPNATGHTALSAIVLPSAFTVPLDRGVGVIVSRPLVASFGSLYEDRVGDVGYTVRYIDGTVLIPRTTAGVTENPTSPGTYQAVASFDTGWVGTIEWDIPDPSIPAAAIEEFFPLPVGSVTVGSYADGQDPMSLIRSAVLSNTPDVGTAEEAWVYARAHAGGLKVVPSDSPNRINVYAPDGTTLLFFIDYSPSSRAPTRAEATRQEV